MSDTTATTVTPERHAILIDCEIVKVYTGTADSAQAELDRLLEDYDGDTANAETEITEWTEELADEHEMDFNDTDQPVED